jgi:hypothetical protein
MMEDLSESLVIFDGSPKAADRQIWTEAFLVPSFWINICMVRNLYCLVFACIKAIFTSRIGTFA